MDSNDETTPDEPPGEQAPADVSERRKVLKKLVVGGGIVAGASTGLPNTWDAASVRRLATPAAAQGSIPSPPPLPPPVPAPTPPPTAPPTPPPTTSPYGPPPPPGPP